MYAAILNNVASFYFEEGEYRKALELFNESLEICKNTFGENSNNYKNILENIQIVKEKIEDGSDFQTDDETEYISW